MLVFLAAATMASAAPTFIEQPCAAPELAGKARCGTVAVPEDRANPGRRTINLNIVVIPASSADKRLPPLFDIEGGPSIADTKNAAFYLTDGAAYHAHRDVVLVDQRGTGGSNGMKCKEIDAAEAAYRPMYPPDAVGRCRVELEKRADLRFYGTTEAVADLDAIRAALGYDQIDLFALSYGTTFALRYMAVYPKTVRVAVLLSVATPMAMVPRYHSVAAERALELLFAECRADPKCARAFDPDRDLRIALANLRAIPGAPSPDVFMEKLRSLMYTPAKARTLPYLIHAAAQRDLKPFFDATRSDGASLFHEGMYLSVTCTESFPLFDYSEAAATSSRTRFGDYRLRRQHEACALWPKGKIPTDFLSLPRTDAAVLLISGQLDPVTPPEWAAGVARSLPNARHVIIPQMGHIFDGMSGIDTCFDPLIIRFYETGNAKSLDASCLSGMQPPPFKTASQ
jgi:pimeloyl-ACP methyl ester carboxylesterase